LPVDLLSVVLRQRSIVTQGFNLHKSAFFVIFTELFLDLAVAFQFFMPLLPLIEPVVAVILPHIPCQPCFVVVLGRC